MAEEISKVGYGLGNDNVSVGSSLKFGGNFGKTYMTKFEYTDKAGKNGAAMEALDIIFKIGGVEKSYRLFPVTKESKLYNTDKDKSNEVVEFGTREWKIAANEATQSLNDRITHIMHCFLTKEELEKGLSVEIKTFKDFCAVCMKILPKDFADRKLDIFLQWQWKISGDNTKTFLEIPSKMKYGKFIVKAEEPVGEWKEDRTDGELHYKDDANNYHTFGRNSWFMESHYATQQKEAGSAEDTMSSATTSQPATTEAAESDNSGW